MTTTTNTDNAEKAWWRSKTIWLGILQLLVGGLSLLADSQFTSGTLQAVLLAIAGVLTVVARFFTNQPLAPLNPKKRLR